MKVDRQTESHAGQYVDTDIDGSRKLTNVGSTSRKLLGGKLATKLIYFVLKKDTVLHNTLHLVLLNNIASHNNINIFIRDIS